MVRSPRRVRMTLASARTRSDKNCSFNSFVTVIPIDDPGRSDALPSQPHLTPIPLFYRLTYRHAPSGPWDPHWWQNWAVFAYFMVRFTTYVWYPLPLAERAELSRI